jgi:hemerythrin-like metal-binding protein
MLFDSISQKDQTKVLNEAFNDLIHYANYHFSREEELMEKYGYSEFLTHKEEHNYFIDKITELKKEFREGDSKVMLHVINFLKDWLLKHIMGTDRNYIQTLKSKGYK